MDMWGERKAYRSVGRLLKKLETPGSKEFVQEGIAAGVRPIIGARRWAEMGAVSITASYLLRTRRGLDREEKYHMLIGAYIQRAQNFLTFSKVSEASEAQLNAWVLVQASLQRR